MIFGNLPPVVPAFQLVGQTVSYKVSHTYVGIAFRMGHRNIFADLYTTKATKARSCGHAIFGVEAVIGHNNLPPREAELLYFARVDPHRIAGCDISIDTDGGLLALLEKVQLAYLQRLLHLNSRSMVASLFTETGITPIRYHRIRLATLLGIPH
jgi:hypothetical protein